MRHPPQSPVVPTSNQYNPFPDPGQPSPGAPRHPVIRRYLKETPLLASPALAERLGFEVHVKCENLQPIGAFKIRGALNVVSSLSPQERRRGVITASTGNHGQAVAYAAGLFGIKAWIYAPERANVYKVESMRRLGAEVVLCGKDFDEARVDAEKYRADRGGEPGLRHLHRGQVRQAIDKGDRRAGTGRPAPEG